MEDGRRYAPNHDISHLPKISERHGASFVSNAIRQAGMITDNRKKRSFTNLALPEITAQCPSVGLPLALPKPRGTKNNRALPDGTVSVVETW